MCPQQQVSTAEEKVDGSMKSQPVQCVRACMSVIRDTEREREREDREGIKMGDGLRQPSSRK